jgi:hypothetical protein
MPPPHANSPHIVSLSGGGVLDEQVCPSNSYICVLILLYIFVHILLS